MENEITTLKTRNYELKKLLSAAQEQLQSAKGTSKEKESEKPEETTPPHHPRGEEPSLGMDSSEAWREKYDIILHENTELRKGLQEILDSFQRLSGRSPRASSISSVFPLLWLHFQRTRVAASGLSRQSWRTCSGKCRLAASSITLTQFPAFTSKFAIWKERILNWGRSFTGHGKTDSPRLRLANSNGGNHFN